MFENNIPTIIIVIDTRIAMIQNTRVHCLYLLSAGVSVYPRINKYYILTS